MDSESRHPLQGQGGRASPSARQSTGFHACCHQPSHTQALRAQVPSPESLPNSNTPMAFPACLRPLREHPSNPSALLNPGSNAELDGSRLLTWPLRTGPELLAGKLTVQPPSFDSCYGSASHVTPSSQLEPTSLNLAPVVSDRAVYRPKIHLPAPSTQMTANLPVDYRRYGRPMSATDISYLRPSASVPRSSAGVTKPLTRSAFSHHFHASEIPHTPYVPIPSWTRNTEFTSHANPGEAYMNPVDSEAVRSGSSFPRFDLPNVVHRSSFQSQIGKDANAAAALTNLSRYQQRIMPNANVQSVEPVMQSRHHFFGNIYPPPLTSLGPVSPQLVKPTSSGASTASDHEGSTKWNSEISNEAFGLVNTDERAPFYNTAPKSLQITGRSDASILDSFHPGSWTHRNYASSPRTHPRSVRSLNNYTAPDSTCEIVGNLHKTVVKTSPQMKSNMTRIEVVLLQSSSFADFLYQTKIRIQQHEGLAGDMWDGPGSQKVKLQSRYPRGAEDIEGILDEATVLDENVYKVLQANLSSRLKEVRDSAIMVEDVLERRLHRQLHFRPVPVEEVDRRMEYIKIKFLRARLVIVEKYMMFVRVLKWVSLSPQRVRRGSHSREQNYELRLWLFKNFRNPYPNPEQKSELMQVCSMTDTQIANWFINGRVRIWKPCINSVNISQAARETLNALEKKRATGNLVAFPVNEIRANHMDNSKEGNVFNP